MSMRDTLGEFVTASALPNERVRCVFVQVLSTALATEYSRRGSKARRREGAHRQFFRDPPCWLLFSSGDSNGAPVLLDIHLIVLALQLLFFPPVPVRP